MIRSILVAVDGSSRAMGVLRSALDIAERFGSTVYLLRAVTIPPEFPAASANAAPADPLPGFLQRKAMSELGTLAAQDPRAAQARCLVREGAQAWRTIIETADELAVDLIAIGSHGYHGLDRVLGTNAGSVANQARRNVFVVHEP